MASPSCGPSASVTASSYFELLYLAQPLNCQFSSVRSPRLLLAIGPCLAFAATGYFSGFGAITAETYPARIRATGQAFTYNLGRLASAGAPYAVGALAERNGFGAAFHLNAAAFLAAAACWLFLS